MTGIRANDTKNSLPLDDAALAAKTFHGWPDFHGTKRGNEGGCLFGKFRAVPLGESGPESTRLSVNQDPNKGRRAKFWARGWNVYYKFHLPQPLFE